MQPVGYLTYSAINRCSSNHFVKRPFRSSLDAFFKKKKSSNHKQNLKENDHAEELFQNKLHGPNRVEKCFGTILCGRQ